MTDIEKECVERVRKQYDKIHENFDDLLDKCNGDAALKRQIGDFMQEALENYIEAQNKILGKSAATINKLNKASEKAQKEIEDALAALENFKKALDTITKAIKTIGTIVAVL